MTTFTKSLIDWYRGNKRDLPWRKTNDPYPVWLSEIILQQTRVEQGLPYWERFVNSYPSVADLALANENDVLRLWQGLGYYSRARNLHTTAKYIHKELGGTFPDNYEGLLKLKGIGPYTAAAIASICFNEPRPVVDGNVFRFASRYFCIREDIALNGTRKHFEKLLFAHISSKEAGNFNQAMMEFGASVCTPVPKCSACHFNTSCEALRQNEQAKLPVKSKKIKVRERYFNYLVMRIGDRVLMKQRLGQDIWKGLYDFPMIEGDFKEEEVLRHAVKLLSDDHFVVDDISTERIHLLSHQKIRARFFELSSKPDSSSSVIQKNGIDAFSIKEILNLPKPKLIVNYLSQRKIK